MFTKARNNFLTIKRSINNKQTNKFSKTMFQKKAKCSANIYFKSLMFYLSYLPKHKKDNHNAFLC